MFMLLGGTKRNSMYMCRCKDQYHIAHHRCLARLQNNQICESCGSSYKRFRAKWNLMNEVFRKNIKSDINVRNNIISHNASKLIIIVIDSLHVKRADITEIRNNSIFVHFFKNTVEIHEIHIQSANA